MEGKFLLWDVKHGVVSWVKARSVGL